uniref:THAP-type domain-containing protein n=3 Tax=Lygus hesperus TaxID=30085 RepID=A0A0K8T7D9_LYGHE
MSLSGVPPLLLQLAGREQSPAEMPPNEEEDEDQQMSDSDEMPYIKCEAVYGEDDEDDDMSALPFVRTEMREEDEDDDEEKMKFGMKAPEVGAYVKCSVPSCHSYFEVGNPKYEGFSHFKFPEDPNLRRRWIGIIGQKEDWKPEGAMICSNHFPEGSFVNVVECIQETGQLLSKRTLKPGALPTINLELPASWNMQRLVLPPNNGVQAVTPIAPALPRLAPAAVPPPTPIRSPYCQGRAITLTKNGKRRGRPPKNRPPDDYSPSMSISQLVSTPMAASPVAKSETTTPNTIAATPSSSSSNGVSKPTQMLSQASASVPSPNNPYGISKQLPPFQLLGMGKRKRGRPRKEDSLRRMAECVAVEGAMGWKNNWRRNIPNKRRKLLPALHRPLQNSMSDHQNRIVQLECNVDINNFLNISMNEDSDIDRKPNPLRDLNYFKTLSSNITDLSAASLAELRKIVQGTIDRLRKSEALKTAKREELERRRKEDAKGEYEAKDKRLDVDVKIPPSVSIKAVGPKSSHQGSSSVEEEPIPALTITIRREKTNGTVLGSDNIPAPVVSVTKKEPVDLPPDVSPQNEPNPTDSRISSIKKDGDSSSGEQPSEHEEGQEEDDDEGQGEQEEDDGHGEQEEEEGDSESDNKDGAGESESDNKDGGQDEVEPIENGDASSSIESEDDADGGNEINGESES